MQRRLSILGKGVKRIASTGHISSHSLQCVFENVCLMQFELFIEMVPQDAKSSVMLLFYRFGVRRVQKKS